MVLFLLCVNVNADMLEPIPIDDPLLRNEGIVFRLPDELTRGYILPKLISEYGRYPRKEEIRKFLHVEPDIPVVGGKSGGQVLTLKTGEHDVDIREDVEDLYLEALIFQRTLPLIKSLQELSKSSYGKNIAYHKEIERQKLEGLENLKVQRNNVKNEIKMEVEKTRSKNNNRKIMKKGR
uniref:Uncharacterized protein n=1 Tax=candidate division WOR-3 bacterium TaxID=2052148 RepID=A0A7C4Y4D9_UNCW3